MKKPTKNELLNMPIGTKIETDSKEEEYQKYIKISRDAFETREDKHIYSSEINEDLTLRTTRTYGTKIIKVEKPLYETWEEKEILDEKEKEYLSAVIKPFREDVKCIKLERGTNGDYILIGLKDYDECMLPYFKSETMYKGMEANKPYTLEELGL